MSTDEVEALFEQIKALPLAGQLQLAADLLVSGKTKIALSIAKRAVAQLELELTRDELKSFKERSR
jgi:hypothetical protein